MPVNAFNGEYGWGYDGVLWYAVHEPYGGPAGLARLIDACRNRRSRRADRCCRFQSPLRPVGKLPAPVRAVSVFGPEQPVGRRVNLCGPDADEVRRYVIECALRWMRDFHADGLRLDAVHALVDNATINILEGWPPKPILCQRFSDVRYL